MWMTTSVTPLSFILKRWNLENSWATSKAAVLHFLSLTFELHILLLLQLLLESLLIWSLLWCCWREMTSRRCWLLWLLPSPCLASVVVGLAVGSGWQQVWMLFTEELDCLRVVGLVRNRIKVTQELLVCSLHCWGWETGQALTHFPDEHHPFSSRDSWYTEPRW